ncbi:MAG: 30S ribosomal protein S1 [Nitrospirae bacterium]|nr:30S ribosomal protein S1 [Nitrospirota bacterium]
MSVHFEVDPQYEALLEKSVPSIRPGQIVKGKVVQIGHDRVLVDVGYKSEGFVPISECMDMNKVLKVKLGDEVDVLVENLQDEGGIELSHVKAERARMIADLQEAYERDGDVEGVITQRVKGGFFVDIGGPAFLPGSQVDIYPVKDYDAYVGKSFKFKILAFNPDKRNIILSRKAQLQKEKEKMKQEIIVKIHPGKKLTGKVKNIMPYGVFVDLGGIDGLMYTRDISWSRIRHPGDVLKPGEDVEVVVLKVDADTGKVTLGRKQLLPDPWMNVIERINKGSVVHGKVTKVSNFGAIVEIEPDVEALLPKAEISWDKKIKHPSEVLNQDDEKDFMVLFMDVEKRRIILTLKQLESSPWDTVDEHYAVKMDVKGVVRAVKDFGLFVELEDGLTGLVHNSDITWNRRDLKPAANFRKGEEITVRILRIEGQKKRMTFGLKQIQGDPWNNVADKYKPGTGVKGIVSEVSPEGVFVELEDGVEGLVRTSQMGRGAEGEGRKGLDLGAEVMADVIHVDVKKRRMELSVKSYEDRGGEPAPAGGDAEPTPTETTPATEEGGTPA